VPNSNVFFSWVIKSSQHQRGLSRLGAILKGAKEVRKTENRTNRVHRQGKKKKKEGRRKKRKKKKKKKGKKKSEAKASSARTRSMLSLEESL
jgi:hypothetical protein